MLSQTVHAILLISADDGLREASDNESNYRLFSCAGLEEARQRLDKIQVHLILADCDLDRRRIEALLIEQRVSRPRVGRVLIASPAAAAECAQTARQADTYHYVIKPAGASLLRLVASRALEFAKLSRRHRLLSRELKISIDDRIFAPAAEPLSVKGGLSQFEKRVLFFTLRPEFA